jgi:hypothetical protein
MGTRYAGVWRAGSGPQVLTTDLDWSAFQSKWQELSNQNMRLVDFTTYVKSHWNQSVPSLSGDNLNKFKNYLTQTGAAQDPAQRKLNQDYWGTNAQTISPSLLGSNVTRGQHLAWAGATGPGGCGFSAPTRPNTHLHVFFCRRDPTNNK